MKHLELNFKSIEFKINLDFLIKIFLSINSYLITYVDI